MENVEKYLIQKNSNIKVVKVDCGGNIWTVMRFDIDHIPKIIYVENNEMSLFNDNITYDNIIEFLNNENKIKIPFPNPMSYFEKRLMEYSKKQEIEKEFKSRGKKSKQ